jgi:uncharacterized protein YegJ (DUF2314 family)
MKRCIVAAIALAVLQIAAPVSSAGTSEPSPITVTAIDAEMQAAVAAARNSLNQFWATQEHPGPKERGFALKVAIIDGDKEEHFWLTDVKRDAQTISGVIDNTPALVENVKAGERVEFTEDQIADWVFMRNGKMVGNETMRPLLKRMKPAQAERFRSLYERP